MAGRRGRLASKSKPNPKRFLIIYFSVVLGICVLLLGWKGLFVAPVLILWAVVMALTNKRRRGAVGALMDEGDRDFDRMRRERIARRRSREG
jgi:hypothetical protein